VITHRNADLDAYACGVAVKELLEKMGVQATLVIPEGVSQQVRLFLSRNSMRYLGGDSCSGEGSLVILVDVSTLSQINELRGFIENRRVVVIDHHEVHNVKPDLAIVDPLATSCSEIAALLFREAGFEPSIDTAKLLIGGIVSDSGRLSRARDLTFEVLAWLLRVSGVNYQELLNSMVTEAPFSERMARVKGLLRMRVYRIDDLIICLSNVNAYESSLAETMIRAGCDLALVASEHDDEVRMIGRSSRRLQGVLSLADLFNELAQYFRGEGGGHSTAAALSVKAKVDVWTLLLKALEKVESILGKRAARVTD
jgi:nanoRNase/pAp phosphatase (c-di-AMP/oligoRNAs hydrolase)